MIARIWKRPDGTVSIMYPNYNKYAQSDITEAWWQAEKSKQADLVGAVAVADVEHTTLPWVGNSPQEKNVRQYRRDAHKWNAATNKVEDDTTETTEQEIHAAYHLELDRVMMQGANTPFERKIMARDLRNVTATEIDNMVRTWRASGKSPRGISDFTPPANAKKPKSWLFKEH